MNYSIADIVGGMDTFRKVTSFILIYLIGVFIFFTAALHATFNTFNLESIQSVLEDKNIYQKIVPAVLTTANYSKEQKPNSQLPLGEPWVLDAVSGAFPPKTIESLSANILGGVFGWLEGDTANPEFKIDLTTNKEALANNIGNYVTTRSSGLPVCTLADLQNVSADINIYSAPCRPSLISPELAGQTAKQQVLSDQNFLSDPVITADSITKEAKSSPFKSLEPLRLAYSNQRPILWGSVFFVILLATGGVLLAKDRSKALKSLFRVLLSAGVGLTIFTFFMWFGLKNNGIGTSNEALVKDVLMPTLNGLGQKALSSYVIATILTFAGAAAAFALYKYTSHSKTKQS